MPARCGTRQTSVWFYLQRSEGPRRPGPALAAAREATMAWTNNRDVRWEPGETELTAGQIIYWLTTIIAALMFVFAVADFFISWRKARRSSGCSPWSPRRRYG